MVRKVLAVLGVLSWLGLVIDAQLLIPLPPVSISPTSGTIGTMPIGRIQIAVINRNGISNSVTFERVTGLGELLEIKLTGTAQSFQQLMGGSWWIVRVDRVISGPQPCSEELRVITWTSAAPPVLWGNADPEIKSNDRVQVYGRYIEEAGECSVTLMGSEQYFIRLPIELRSAQIEIRPSSPTTDDEIEVTLRAEFNREFGNSCFAGAQLAFLKREDAATFAVTAGEVPPGLACILVYRPTTVGQYTHQLGKLPAGEYLFKLYDFEKLFISEPFQVRESMHSIIARALDENSNRRLDDPEIIRAINLWIRQEPAPGTGGRRITDATMLTLLDLWVKERPIE